MNSRTHHLSNTTLMRIAFFYRPNHEEYEMHTEKPGTEDEQDESNDPTDSQADPVECCRIERFLDINRWPGTRAHLIKQYGQVWDTRELNTEFEVLSYREPYVDVRRRADGRMGSLEFQRNPRFYFNFRPYKG